MKTQEILVNGEPIDYSGLPEGLRWGMEGYLIHGVLPGHFLRAVICNDLEGAVFRAGDKNILLLREIVRWVNNHAPPRLHGSCELMDTWARLRRPDKLDPNA